MILLSTDEFAAAIGYSPQHISKLLSQGVLKPYQLVGNRAVWIKSQVQEAKEAIARVSSKNRGESTKATWEARRTQASEMKEELATINSKLDRLLEMWG